MGHAVAIVIGGDSHRSLVTRVYGSFHTAYILVASSCTTCSAVGMQSCIAAYSSCIRRSHDRTGTTYS